MIGKLCFRSQAAIPEFLSTHPSDITRINQIEQWTTDALRYYKPSGTPSPLPAPIVPPRVPDFAPELRIG